VGAGDGHAMSSERAVVTLVRPASAKLETLAILLVVAVLVAATVAFARASAVPEQNVFIADWQVSALTDLSPVDQANYNALLFAGDTIQVWYDDTYARGEPHWPTVEELSDLEVGLSPFMHDVSWKQGGEVQWQLIASYNIDGATAYFGNAGKVRGQSAYLLLIAHLHKGASYRNQSIVWIHRNPDAQPPATINVDSLVRNGWKQVVPYRGADEIKRLRGTG
jgi:hypothetical protein